MKKILLSCVTCLLAVGLLAGCNEEEEVTPEEPEVPGTVVDEGGETTYLFGFEVDGTMQYIDGGLVEFNGTLQSYEGSVTDDVSKAVAISYEVSGSAYYLSFENEGVTNWITIITGEHTNLSYATEKSPIYLHTTDGGAEYFGNEDGDYFLSYNSTYDCLYASSVSSWLTSSPVAGLYTTDGELIAGGVGEEPTPAIEPVLGTVTTGDYFLGFTMSETNYYFNGEVVSSYYGGVTSLGYEAVVITVAEVTDGYTLSFTDEEEATQYLNMTESETNRNLKWGEDPFTWSYDTTYETFVAKDSTDVWQFIGTYGTNTRLSLSDYGYLTGDKSTTNAQYPAKLFEVITYNDPTAISISGAEDNQTLEEGTTLQLTTTVTGTDPVNGKIIWESSNEEAATVVDGLVSAVSASETPVEISATSAASSTVTASVSITITAEVPVELGNNVYRLGVADAKAATYRWFTTISSSAGQTTRYWNSGTDVEVVTKEDCTDSTGTTVTGYAFKYVSGAYTDYIGYGSSTNLSYKTEPYYWALDEDSGAYIDTIDGSSGRFLGLQSGYEVLKAYAVSNLPTEENPYSYYVATLYHEAPSALEQLPKVDV